MKRDHWLKRIIRFYVEGFRAMTLGRALWAVILIKLVIIFAVLRLFFFPDYIGTHSEEGQEADFVSNQLIDRAYD